MKIRFAKLAQLFVETIGLSSARGRIIFFLIVSGAIFVWPPTGPFTLSVWQHLGVESPSIGLTRAYRRLLHGEFTQAWQQNKIIFIVVAVGIVVLAKDVIALVNNSKQASLRKKVKQTQIEDRLTR